MVAGYDGAVLWTTDGGGTWLGEGHDEMYALVDALGLETFPTWNDAGTVLLDLGDERLALLQHGHSR